VRGWLVDTNVISELRKPRCHDAVRTWSEAQAPELLHLSRITIAEIRFGIEQHPSGNFRERLATWLDEELRPWFAERILEVDEEVILEWRRMVQRGKALRHTFSQPDLFIAATAAVSGLSVVTRNVADFALAGVPVLNPWTGELRSR
jgi:predicted nucleic acid-binding protein